ncbi:ATP-dependent DNA helicase [Trichonephila clavipes]|nr:ATP-dependent DNA helicase [Trichonephila clavipes]
MCCSGGKVQLPTLEPYPEPLHSLLTHQDPLSEHILSTIHKHNGCFQMASFGAKEIKVGNFMPTFKVQGQVYHRIGSLMAAIDSLPKDQKEFKVVINAERKPFGEHKGRFTVPQTKEVTVVIVGQEFEKRDIVLSCRSGTLMRINETHRTYDALQYPLMFFRGEDGYQINAPKSHETTQIPLSKMVTLPSSFTGESRYMHERTQDAMTYVQHFGRPDLFITFTCYPKWPEIVDLLNQGQ